MTTYHEDGSSMNSGKLL